MKQTNSVDLKNPELVINFLLDNGNTAGELIALVEECCCKRGQPDEVSEIVKGWTHGCLDEQESQ